MKQIYVYFVFAVFAVGTHAKEIISPAIRDGGFESGSLSAGAWECDGLIEEKLSVFSRETVKSGAFALGLGNGTAAPRTVFQNTGYVVNGRETLNLEFYAGARYGWDKDDSITATLFITDNNLKNGKRTEIARFTAKGFANSNPSTGMAGYAGKSFGGTVYLSSLSSEVQSAVADKKLFVAFSAACADLEFARVDDVTLTAVQPPATLGLILACR